MYASALYRKATACDHLGELNLAKECLDRALQVNANNLKAQDLLRSVEKELQSKLGATSPGSATGGTSSRAKGKGKKIQIEEVSEDLADVKVPGPIHVDVGGEHGSHKGVDASDQPSAPPVNVLSHDQNLQTRPHRELDDEQQRLRDSDSDSGQLHLTDNEKLCSGDSDKVQSSDSDKVQSSDSDKVQSSDSDKVPSSVSDKQNSSDSERQQFSERDEQKPSDAASQWSPPPDVSVLPNHLPSDVHVMKREGNELFQKGQYTEALEKYSQALQSLEKGRKLSHITSSALVSDSYPSCSGAHAAMPPGSVSGRCMLLNNRAACWLKLGDCNQCVKDCSSSIELYTVNIKAFARRAQAFEHKEKWVTH